MILTGYNPVFMDWFVHELGQEFSIKDLGYLHYFLAIEVHRFNHGLFLCQSKYAQDLLACDQMEDCKPLSTPMVIKGRLPSSNQDPFPDPTYYRIIVGALQHLTFTKPNLSYRINFICQFVHVPIRGRPRKLFFWGRVCKIYLKF